MSSKARVKKDVFSIRLPTALNHKLESIANEIGISKCAVILSLLHEALENKSENLKLQQSRQNRTN